MEGLNQTRGSRLDPLRYSKEDYMKLDNTISFIFKDSSYLVDCVGSDTDYTVFLVGPTGLSKFSMMKCFLHESLKSGKSLGGGDNLTAGMPGKIVKIFVAEGDEVKAISFNNGSHENGK